MMSVIGLGLAIALAVIIPAFFITKQEIAIEGPFGWSALTFTKRFSTKSWISKVYRSYSGKDKWATEYHLASNAVWLFIYLVSFVYLLIYTKVAGDFDLKAFAGAIALAVASEIVLSISEDYIWFLIHPYFGPNRLTSDYIPWHKNLKAGIPIANWKGLLTSIIIVSIMALLISEISIFLIWVIALAFIVAFCLGVRLGSIRVKRKPLAKFWWVRIKYVVIKRAPYASESFGSDVQKEAVAYVIPNDDMVELLLNGTAIKLEEALAGEKV